MDHTKKIQNKYKRKNKSESKKVSKNMNQIQTNNNITHKQTLSTTSYSRSSNTTIAYTNNLNKQQSTKLPKHTKTNKSNTQSSLLSMGFTKTARPPPGLPLQSTNNNNNNNNNNKSDDNGIINNISNNSIGNNNSNNQSNNNIQFDSIIENVTKDNHGTDNNNQSTAADHNYNNRDTNNNDTDMNDTNKINDNDDDDDDDIMMEMEQLPTRQYTPTPTKNHNNNPSYASIARTPPRSSRAHPREITNKPATNNNDAHMQHQSNTINASNPNVADAISIKSGKHKNDQNLRNQRKRIRSTNTAQQHPTNPSETQTKSRQQSSLTPNTTMSPPRKKQKSTNHPTKPPLPPTPPPPPIPLSPPPPTSPTITIQMPAANQYTCCQCNNIFNINKHGWHDGSMKPFLVQFVCQQCTSNIAHRQHNNNNHNHNSSHSNYTIYRCTQTCPKAKSPFNNRHAYRSWKSHYQRYHPTDTAFLYITQQQICKATQCDIVIPNTNDLCPIHQQQQIQQPQSARIQPTILNEHTILDADNQPFDVYRTLQFIKCNEHIYNDEVKHTVINKLTKSLHKIAKFHTNPQLAMIGLLQYRLLAPTYLQVPYRDDYQINRKNKLLKIQYYEQQRWNKLMDMIEQEQNKHNERELRRINNLNRSNNDKPIRSNTNPTEQKYADSNTFINDTQSQPFADPLDLNAIAHSAQRMKYYEDDTEKTIKQRIKRSIKKAKKGQWKKADTALGDGAVVNLYINNNWKKTQNKFVDPQPIPITNNSTKSSWNLTPKEVHNILKNIPPQSAGGNSAINNDIILWAINNDNVSDIVGVITKLAKTMIHHTMTGTLRKLFLYTKGLPLGKPDKNKANPKIDDDVRPIVICDSIIRTIDKIAYENIPIDIRTEVMGPYQVVGRPNAAEVATEGVNRALMMLGLMDNMTLISLDATNAFNSINRTKLYELISMKIPDLIPYFLFLYGGSIDVQFDAHHMLQMQGGAMQGMATSNLLYSAAKWCAQQK